MDKPKPKQNRRRGDELLESLYEATTSLTRDIRHSNLTFQQIADAAKTSRTVLYRRWATPYDLLQEIFTYKAARLFDGSLFLKLSDNGSLRGDLLQLITEFQAIHDEIGAEVIVSYYYLRSQDKLNEKKPSVHVNAVGEYVNAMQIILERAVARGEKVRGVSQVTRMLPFDIIRIENLVRPGIMNHDRLVNIVDDVLLPVFLDRGFPLK